jgi:hypothetical protein
MTWFPFAPVPWLRVQFQVDILQAVGTTHRNNDKLVPAYLPSVPAYLPFSPSLPPLQSQPTSPSVPAYLPSVPAYLPFSPSLPPLARRHISSALHQTVIEPPLPPPQTWRGRS